MTDESARLLLTAAASKALIAFAERIGQDPQALAAEAIERFIAEEEPIAEEVLKRLDELHQGRFLTHEDVVARMEERMAHRSRKRA